MGISRQAVASMEASERAGTARLESLRRVARSVDCLGPKSDAVITPKS